MASPHSPCAACKCRRQKCTPECVFAPYFPPENPEKFACVHNVFGAGNVSKILSELSPMQRDDAVNSLAYEAQTRIQDPIYGCVALISMLQQKLKQVQEELHRANRELSLYIQPSGDYPFLAYNNLPNNGQMVIPEPHSEHVLKARQLLQQQQQQKQQCNNEMVNGGVVVTDLGLGSHENRSYQVQENFCNMQLQTEDTLSIQQHMSGTEDG